MIKVNRINWLFAGLLLIGFTLLFGVTQLTASAQQSEPELAELEQRIFELEQEMDNLRNLTESNLQSRVNDLERNVGGLASSGLVLFLYASFCALWAQNTRRNAVLLFILGGIFNIFTVMFLLYVNWNERTLE